MMLSTISMNNDSFIDTLWIHPNRIRFQHSKIRPYFSSCGRSIQQTLDEIRSGMIRPYDLPYIQVVRCHQTNNTESTTTFTNKKNTKKRNNNIRKNRNKKCDDKSEQRNEQNEEDIMTTNPKSSSVENHEGEEWYVSLNNRRLYVLKQCYQEGLLASTSHLIPVRLRPFKSMAETKRYTVQNCSLHATIMTEDHNSESIKQKISRQPAKPKNQDSSQQQDTIDICNRESNPTIIRDHEQGCDGSTTTSDHIPEYSEENHPPEQDGKDENADNDEGDDDDDYDDDDSDEEIDNNIIMIRRSSNNNRRNNNHQQKNRRDQNRFGALLL